MSNPETSNPITTTTEPAVMSPLKRWMRTAVQVVVALAAAVPALAAIFDVSAETSAKLAAGMGVLVTLVSAAHNAFNAQQAAPTATRDRGDINLSTLFLVLALICFIIGALIAHGSIRSDEGITWLFGGLICWVLAILLPSLDRGPS